MQVITSEQEHMAYIVLGQPRYFRIRKPNGMLLTSIEIDALCEINCAPNLLRMKGSVIPANVPWGYLQHCLDELDMIFGSRGGHAIVGTPFVDSTDLRNKPLTARIIDKIMQALRDRAVREAKVFILSTYSLRKTAEPVGQPTIEAIRTGLTGSPVRYDLGPLATRIQNEADMEVIYDPSRRTF